MNVNVVQLGGRISGDPVERTLPSGATVAEWRLVVLRTPEERARDRVTHDTVQCVAVSAGAREQILACGDRDQIILTGALRRSVRRRPAGITSLYRVEAHAITRVAAE